MAESTLLRDLILAFSRGDTRLWRFNSGVAWQGRVIEQSANRLVLAYPRAVRLGIEGMSDLIGITSGGRFCAIEGKHGSTRVTPEQSRFLELIRELGGVSGVARSVEDGERILRGAQMHE